MQGAGPARDRRGMNLDEALRRAERLVHAYAGSSAYQLAPDPVVLRTVIQGLARNWAQHGLPYCPCKELTGDRAQDKRLVCPCTDHHEEIRQTGSCCCGLYWEKGE